MEYAELVKYVMELREAVMETMDLAIENGNVILHLQKYVSTTNEMIADILAEMGFIISVMHLKITENVDRLNDLEILYYNIVEMLTLLTKISIGSVGLGLINTVLIVTLFTMYYKQKKCMCLKPKEKLKRLRKAKNEK